MNTLTRLLTVATLLAVSHARAAEDGFVSLFNGQNLEGWEGNPAIWSVKDGAITGETKPDTNLKHNTFLVWKAGTVADFELRLSYRIVKGNSGIQYRSKVIKQGPDGPIVGGYQADFEAGKTYSGILYEEQGRGILAQRGQMVRITSANDGKHKVDVTGKTGDSAEIQAAIKDEGWNDYVVIAKGNHLVHMINQRVTVDVTDEDAAHAAKSGVLALQVHAGPPMVVQFKNLRIKQADGSAAVAPSDIDQVQGEWVGVSGKGPDGEIPADWAKSLALKITGDKYSISWTDGGDAGRLKMTGSGSPKEIDIQSDGSGELKGIYEIRDGQLRIAHGVDGAARPKNFDAGAGSSSLSLTYKRK